LIHGNHFGVGQDFFAVAEKRANIAGDDKWSGPETPEGKFCPGISWTEQRKTAGRGDKDNFRECNRISV
jgi:hypothetical protein